MAKIRNRFLLPIVGAMRGGKTFWAQTMATDYANSSGCVLVYNVGKDEDFPDGEYELIEALTFNEHVSNFYAEKSARQNYALDRKVEYFWYNGEAYHFKMFTSMFWGKKVKMRRIANRIEETAFSKAVYEYLSCVLVVLDDSRVTFKYGLNDGWVQLFSRINHAGGRCNLPSIRSAGVDVIVVSHNIDHINEDVWDYATNLVLFNSNMKPNYKKFDSAEMIPILEDARERLKDSPLYTALQIDLQGDTIGEINDVTIKI